MLPSVYKPYSASEFGTGSQTYETLFGGIQSWMNENYRPGVDLSPVRQMLQEISVPKWKNSQSEGDSGGWDYSDVETIEMTDDEILSMVSPDKLSDADFQRIYAPILGGLTPQQQAAALKNKRAAIDTLSDARQRQNEGGGGILSGISNVLGLEGTFLGDILAFEDSNLTGMLNQVEENPERIFIGAADPISTDLWNSILGTDYEPIVNQWGGATEQAYIDAQNKGIDTGPGSLMHSIAQSIAASYAGNWAGGQLSNMFSGATGGGAGGTGAAAGGGGAGGAGGVSGSMPAGLEQILGGSTIGDIGASIGGGAAGAPTGVGGTFWGGIGGLGGIGSGIAGGLASGIAGGGGGMGWLDTAINVGGNLLGSYLSGQAAQDAAQTQAGMSEAAIAEQRRQFDAYMAAALPYMGLGNTSMGNYVALSGLGGADAQKNAIAAIEQGQNMQALSRAGEEAILQNAAATGGLRGGNTQGALATNRQNILQGLIDRQLMAGQYGINTGLGAVTQTGSAGMSMASNIGNLLGQQGAALAGGQLASGQYQNNMIGGVARGIGTLGTQQGWW